MVKIHSAEFDNCGTPSIGKVSLVFDGKTDKIVINLHGEVTTLIEASRDQWGVFYCIDNKETICQEDGTRSFIDALIKCLQQMKLENECDTTETLLKEEI